jgi:hypothetical protein
MKCNSSNDVALSTMGCPSSMLPTNIRSSPDLPFSTQVREGSPGTAPAKSVDQATFGPGSTSPPVSIVVPTSHQVLVSNQSSNAAFPTSFVPTTTQNAPALLSPVLGGQEVHARRAPRRRHTPRYSHVPPIQLELLLDNAASLTEMLQDMEQVRRPSLSPCHDDPVGIADGRDDINQGSDEFIDDGSSSVASFESDWIDDTAKYSPSRSRSAVAWRHYFQNRSNNLHQSTYSLRSDIDMSRSVDDIAPTA